MSDSILKYIAIYQTLLYLEPQNEIWWGKGFTDWKNVKSAFPLFEGHDQPRVPHKDWGYYDNADVNLMIRQAKVAKEHGIYGFSFYYTWVDGRRLFEKPIFNMLNTPEVDIPFFLCWANLNLSRKWDIAEEQLLLKQTYAPKFWEKFVDDIMPFFKDPRYIRVNGKHVLSIYQPRNIPDAKNFPGKLRAYAKEKYGIELYLIAVDEINAPISANEYNYDAVLEKAPTWSRIESVDPAERPKTFEPMEMTYLDYRTTAIQSILREEQKYPVFQSVFSRWDNSARRKTNNPVIFHQATPENYEVFLSEISKKALQTLPKEECFVFLDAWNEWGEGTYLEPDERYGYTFLNIVKKISQLSKEEWDNTNNDAVLYKWCKLSKRNRKKYIESLPSPKKEKDLFHLKMKLSKKLRLFFQIKKVS